MKNVFYFSFRSRDIEFFVIFPFPNFPDSKGQMKWNNLRIGLHKFAAVIFKITPKPLYITPLNLVR